MEWNGHFMGPSGLDLRDCSVVWWWWWRRAPNLSLSLSHQQMVGEGGLDALLFLFFFYTA